jgi:GrpB-like predicted nucleotidyltransferase (UPF0157 family)
MPLTSKIATYNPDWPSQYEVERERLVPIFGGKLLRIDHVGSTAVPLLSAKPEIDILVELSDNLDLAQFVSPLMDLGYRRGGDLSAGHHFFKRDVDGVRTHKLHVMTHDHPEVSRMLDFRDHLRNNARARIEYQRLKIRLEQENTRGIGEYLAQKAPFIDATLNDLRAASFKAFAP